MKSAFSMCFVHTQMENAEGEQLKVSSERIGNEDEVPCPRG